MTNSQSKLFTLSKEKRPEVDGSTNQMFGKHGKATIIKRIEQNLLAAIGMVTENARLQYLFNPHIHYDIDGNPSKIIGNASNEKGEFTLLEIDIKSSLTYFTAVKINDRAPAGTEGPSPLPQVLCEGTKWATNDTESVIICSLCKLFPVFFGQEIVHGSLTDDETREKFAEGGTGFEAYGDLANAAFTSAVDNNKILANIGAITASGLDICKMKEGCVLSTLVPYIKIATKQMKKNKQSIYSLFKKRTVWVGGSVGFLVGETDGPAEGLRVGEAVGLLVG